MNTRKAFLALVAVAGVALATPAASASAASASVADLDPGALVRVININPSTGGDITEVTLGDNVPQALVFGSATTFVRMPPYPDITIDQEVVRLEAASAGCMVTVILTGTDGGEQQRREFPECSPERVDTGTASVRFINATADSGAVKLDYHTAVDASPVEPYSSGDRRQAPAGTLTIQALSPAGERLGERTVEAAPDTAYTALWAGGGETPLRLLWLEDGRQPYNPPPPDLPIDTDAPTRQHLVLPIAFVTISTAVLMGVLFRRRMPVLIAVMLLFSACAHDPAPVGSSSPTVTSAPTAPTVPTTTDGTVGLPASLSSSAANLEGAVVAVNRGAGPALPNVLPGDVIGWFEQTSRPGAAGTALLAGHVVSRGSDGVFAELDELEAGSTIEVTDDLGAVHTFTVHSTATTPKGALDPALFGFSPEPRLLLVTCAGRIDPQRGLRSENLLLLATAPQPPSVVDAQ
ncbi:MAG: hypothetical protein JJLCMIEE_02713 [Acidimicrobiales bacterium]|nr:hypothetical protein [Acidimicrobiales bacterium]